MKQLCRKFFSVFLTLALCVNALPTQALAAELGEGQSIPASEAAPGDSAVVWLEESFADVDIPDNDELFDGYLEQRLYEAVPNEPAPLERGLALQSLPERDDRFTAAEAAVFEQLEEFAREAAAGLRETALVEIDLSSVPGEFVWTASDLGVSPSSNEATSRAWKLIQNQLSVNKIWHALMVAHPFEMYWFDKTVGILHGPRFKYVYGDSGAIVKLQATKIEFKFEVESAYNNAIPSFYYDKSSGRTYKEAGVGRIPRYCDFGASQMQTTLATLDTVKRNAQAIVKSNANSPAFDRLTAYKDAICERTSYDFAAAADDTHYTTAYQLISVFDGVATTRSVCEGYAKAFQYLCDLEPASIADPVDCYTVTGDMFDEDGSENHMWNVVRMPDSKNYLVDVTNCDAGMIGAPDLLFIKPPTEGSIEDGYIFKMGADQWVGYSYDSNNSLYLNSSELTLANTSDVAPATKKRLTEETCSITPIEDQTYSGVAINPEPTVSYEGVALQKDVDYTLSWENNVNAGGATLTIAGVGKYTGSLSRSFQILPATITSVVPSKTSLAANGKAQKPALTVYAGRLKVPTNGYSASYSNNTKVGTATVKVSGKANFTGEATATFNITFKDVHASDWFFAKVHEAKNLGLVEGKGDGSYYDPYANITRADIVVILWRMAGKPAGTGANFKDVPIIDPQSKTKPYYYDALLWAKNTKVVSGVGSDAFNPKGLVTREQLAIMIRNYAQKIAGKNVDPGVANYTSKNDAYKVNSWSQESVSWCFNNKLLEGDNNGNINPQGRANRAAAAKMVLGLYDYIKK